jgi:aspartate aminotransferase/aminotransferase
VVEKRRQVAELMDTIGLRYLPGTATFYFFVSILPSRLLSEEFCTRLLLEDHISVVPGKGYGESCDRFIRLSIGTESLEDIERGLLKLKELIDKTSEGALAV